MLEIPDPSPSIREKAASDSRAIYLQIREGIFNGLFTPGTRLPTERQLAQKFGAARNTVRSSLERLVAEGLIVRQVGRGTYVAESANPERSQQEEFTLAELLEARLLFEPNLPDLVVERATESDLAHMDACLEFMREATSWSDYKEAKYALHIAIARASHNRFIISIFEQILASRRRAGWNAPGPRLLPEVREAAWRENREIIDHLRNGNAAAAREAIRNYLLRILSVTGTF